MEISGEWKPRDDGVVRPVLTANLVAQDGTLWSETFLIDSGADCTVLRAELIQSLGYPAGAYGNGLQGISGSTPAVQIATTLAFVAAAGTTVHVKGPFAAFTDPAATDIRVLGRDVLNSFDLILSRRRNQVLLLAGNHFYTIGHS
jgi:Retroviral aspartyl protease